MKFRETNPDICIGTVITSYHDGYHRVTKLFIEEVYGITCNMVEYKRLCDFNGAVSNTDINTCHIRYCSLVDPIVIYDYEVTKAKIKKDRLLGMINDS